MPIVMVETGKKLMIQDKIVPLKISKVFLAYKAQAKFC